MICKPCRAAADSVEVTRESNMSRDSLQVTRGFDFPVEVVVRAVASMFHGLCKGSTHCDCQHFVDMQGVTISRGQA